MHIEISGAVEELIRAELAAGRFRTPEECITVMARNWKEVAMNQGLPSVPKDIAVDSLALNQGVEVSCDAKELKADFWPENEAVNDFISDIRKLRAEESTRVR